MISTQTHGQPLRSILYTAVHRIDRGLTKQRFRMLLSSLSRTYHQAVLKLKVHVPRSGAAEPALQSFEVEVGDQASVLDVLFALQRGPAPDLAFRFSCRVGMRGSCAVVVNGREQLACSRLAQPLGPEFKIDPWRNLVRDVAVDMEPSSMPLRCESCPPANPLGATSI